MSQPKPLLTIGRYQFTYRTSSQTKALAQADNALPVGFHLLRSVANIGTILALVHLLMLGLSFYGMPIWGLLIFFLVLLFVLNLNLGAFLDSFYVIDTSQTKIQKIPKVGVLHWLWLAMLAVLSGLLLYLKYVLKVPSTAQPLITSELVLISLALPYYAHQLRKRLVA